MLLASGQPIPHGRPYRYHLNGPVHMITVRKRVGPLPTHRLVVRHLANHSSSDSSLEASSDFHSDVGPLRTSVPALSLAILSRAVISFRADLIPSPKRVRDSGYSADVEVDPRETSLRMKLLVKLEMTSLEMICIYRDSAEIDDVCLRRMLLDIGLRLRVTLGDLVSEDFHITTQAIPSIVYRLLREFKESRTRWLVESVVIALTKRITELERYNVRLRGTISVEKLVNRRVAEEMEAREAARTLEPLNENGDEQEGENGGNGNGGNGGNGNG
ncbi:hypothetical protein Tco_0694335 [Tanacetum coccineum]